jgi:hypothetical protein
MIFLFASHTKFGQDKAYEIEYFRICTARIHAVKQTQEYSIKDVPVTPTAPHLTRLRIEENIHSIAAAFK